MAARVFVFQISVWRTKAFPLGGRCPEGADEGTALEYWEISLICEIVPLFSLALLDSFPPGGSHGRSRASAINYNFPPNHLLRNTTAYITAADIYYKFTIAIGCIYWYNIIGLKYFGAVESAEKIHQNHT